MRWDIEGADRTTGEDVNIFVDAGNENDARVLAQARNIIVSSVTQMLETRGADEEHSSPIRHKQKWQYRMVQIPRDRVISRKKDMGTEAASYLQHLANQLAADGWEFYRIDTVGVVNPAGLVMDDQYTSYQIITFRRSVDPK